MCRIHVNAIRKSHAWFFSIGYCSQNSIRYSNIVYQQSRQNLTKIFWLIRMRVSKKIQMVYIFSRLRKTAMGSHLNSWLLFVCTEPGRVEDIQNGFPSTIYGGVRRWARYVISANYLLRYFYIQYIRERRLAGASSNPLGHTGDLSWERRNPT